MNKSVNTRYSREAKKSFVIDWQQSGQTKKNFTQEKGLNYETFLVWVAKETRIQNPVHVPIEKPVPSFVSIQVEHSGHVPQSNNPLMEITLANGSCISFYQTVPTDYLRDLLK